MHLSENGRCFLYPLGVGLGAAPVGALKSLPEIKHKTGAPSRAQKSHFKAPIDGCCSE